MIAARWAMLLSSACLALAAIGAADPDLSASARQVSIAAVVALLAPLFWPGLAATASRSMLRVAAWSAGAVVAAAIALRLFGVRLPPLPWLWMAPAMLLVLMLVAHAAAAGLEARWRKTSGDAASAREAAGRAVALALALAGSLPLWLGPAAELLWPRHDWIIDAVVGVSPLTHLAVAAGNDLLRNPWLYLHANLAALPASYPEFASLLLIYTAAIALLACAAFLQRQRRSRAAAALPVATLSETER